MRTSLLFLLSAFLLPSFASYAEISTHLLPRKDGSEISYYMDKRAEKNQTLLVLMQGSDCNSIKNNVFVDAFYQLNRDINQPNVKFIKYEKLDHGFYNEQGERLTNKIINDIQHWYSQYEQQSKA